ncbi:MAG: DNA polymerase III subunit gamma/tau [Chloroflexota bacterium]|nr:DNA polymerase III subunit gamma/tau [Chloroflexota bacterium]
MSDVSLFDTSSLAAEPALTASATHSLYRKYRPTTFADDDLVGQEHVVNTLRNAIALNRISHAYLFCGPRGTGKTTTARLLAKAVNCLDPDPLKRPCNTCSSCVAINTNATTDVIEIDAASNRGIDDIRDLRERVKYAPSQLKTKFYIVDEAHQITGAAANAFLKTLEEPPPHTKFILATTDPEELLPTIVSRCQRFDFRRINLEAMIARLRNVADREQIQIEDDALPVISRQATGSLRDALGMLDQVAVYRESASGDDAPITADMVRTVLGVSRNERVEALAQAMADRDPAAGLREISAAVDAGDDIRQLGRQFVAYIRLLLLQKAGGAVDADDTAVNLASLFSLDELAGLIRQLSDIDFRAKRSAFPQLPLEIAMVEGASRGQRQANAQPDQREAAGERPGETVRNNTPEPPTGYGDDADQQSAPPIQRTSLRDRVRGTAAPSSPMTPREPARQAARKPADRSDKPADDPEPVAHSNQPAAAAVPAPTSSSNGLTLATIVDLWPKIRADVKAVNRRIEALLQQVDPAAVNGSQIVLVSPYEFHRNRVNTDEVRQVVESVIGRLVNVNVQVTCLPREEAMRMAGNGAAADQIPAPTVAAPDDAPREDVPTAVEAGPPASEPITMVDVVDAEGVSDDQRKADLARITAAKNIFDAEEVTD